VHRLSWVSRLTITGLPVVLKFLKFLKFHRCPEIVLKSAIVLKFYSFGQNVLKWTLGLIFKFVATRWHLLRLKCTKFDFGWGGAPDPTGEAYSALPRRPLDWFELSKVNWTCLYMLIKVPVCFSSYNNNIYEDRKTCIFCVLSLVKPTKMSWNFLKIGSWNFTSCSWGPAIINLDFFALQCNEHVCKVVISHRINGFT